MMKIVAFSAQIPVAGTASRFSTTQLLSMGDWVEACKKAKAISSGYAAPS